MGKYKNKLGWTLFYNVTHKQNMETWCIILISLCILATLSLLCNSNKKKLPPGPFAIPILGNFLWLRHPLFELELILRNLHAKYGHIVTLRIGPRLAIFIACRSIAHQHTRHLSKMVLSLLTARLLSPQTISSQEFNRTSALPPMVSRGAYSAVISHPGSFTL